MINLSGLSRPGIAANWLFLRYQHEPWWQKPPLLTGITAVLYGVVGVNEVWARAASALSGVALVTVIYLVGGLVYREPEGSASVRAIHAGPVDH